MSWIKNLFNAILPQDDSDACGYSLFKLDETHPFTPACRLHDYEFEQANKKSGDKTLAQTDWDLFYRMVLIAKAQATPEKQCALALEACEYWPLARRFGGYLWDGDPKDTTGINLRRLLEESDQNKKIDGETL